MCLTSISEKAAAPELVGFTAPGPQVAAILDAAEAVRIRLVLFGATGGHASGSAAPARDCREGSKV
jgi:hypothetical protein